jgi:hypothetical protein
MEYTDLKALMSTFGIDIDTEFDLINEELEEEWPEIIDA